MRQRPILWFYVIAVAIVIIIIPIFLFSGAQEGLEVAIDKAGIEFNTDLVTAFRVVAADIAALPGVLLAIAQVASPDIAVLIVVLIAFGTKGLIELKKRFRFWAADIPWQQALRIWGLCIAVFTLMNLATAGLNSLMLAEADFVWDVNFLSINFVISFLIAMFLDAGAVFEENGWRGFVLPRLQTRFTPLIASIILGLLWAFWHLPVKFDIILDYGFVNFLLIFGVITIKFVFLTIIMTYFFNKVGQTTIIAIMMHGLSNDSVRLGGRILSDTSQTYLITEMNLLIPMLVVAIGLIMMSKGQLGYEAE
ncbi:MAG: CPBP family intramembrane metalloprotease [Chitinophagaceae bacterium]|nr:CPBP family intramembrane metalloprotease [Anaerolineae bacterium]